MPAGGAKSARPLFRASAACFLMRPCLRGALYNTHICLASAGHFNPAFPFRKSQKCGRLPSLTSFSQNRIPRYGKNAIPPFGKFAVRKIASFKYESAPVFRRPQIRAKNSRKKNARTYAAQPEKENRTIPYLEFSESPAPSDSPPSPCAPLPSASSSSTSGMV